MATRFYLPSTGSAEVTPANDSWNKTTGAASALKAVRQRISSSMATVTNTKDATTLHSSLIRQYVTEPLSAQTISGTVSGFIRCIESNGQFSACVAISIRACSEDGGTIRSPALLAISNSDLYTGAQEMPTSLAARAFMDAAEDTTIGLTSCNLSEGDRLIIEIGYKASDTSTTRTGGISCGDNSSTDLSSSGEATANNPWVEFSQTLSFPSPDRSAAIQSTSPDIGATGAVGTVTPSISASISGVVGGPRPYTQEVLADSPIVYYRLNDSGATAVDSSGNGRNGTYANMAAQQVAGATSDGDTAAQFGSNSSLTIPSGVSLALDSPVTVEFWLYQATADVNTATIFTIGNLASPSRCSAQVYTDKKLYWDYGDTTNGRVSVDYTPYLDKWTHVAIVSAGNGGNFRAIYLDGSLVASQNSSDGPNEAVSGGLISGNIYSVGYIYAKVDDFSVYNTVLSEPRISAHHAAGIGAGSNVGSVTATVEESPDRTLALTGIEAIGEVGDAVPGISPPELASFAAAAEIDSVTPSSSIQIEGEAAVEGVDSVSPSIELAASGEFATGEVGDVTVQANDITLPLTGIEAPGAVDSVAPSATLALSGIEAIGEEGDVTSSQIVTEVITGVEAIGAEGDLAPGLAPPLTTVAATGEVGSVVGGQVISGVEATGQIESPDAAISIELAGISATGLVETMPGAIQRELVGIEATSSVDTPVASPSLALSGIEAPGQVESPAEKSITVELSGVQGTGEVGTVTTGADVTQPLTGIEAPGAVETLAPSSSLALAGEAATGEVEQPAAQIATALGGVEAVGAVEAATPSSGLTLAGEAATGQVEQPAAQIVVALGGVEATGHAGDVTPAVVLSGVEAAGQVETVGVSATVALTGIEATGEVDSVTASQGTQEALTGVEATGQIEAPAAEIAAAATGIEATGEVQAPTGNVTVALTGVSGTGAAGDVVGGLGPALTGIEATGVAADTAGVSELIAPLEGVEGIGEVGNVSVPGIVALTGVEAIGRVGSVDTATRFHLPASGTAPVSPTISAEWEHSSGTRRPFDTGVGTTALANTTYTPDSSDHLVDGDAMVVQFVSARSLAAQVIPAQAVKWQFQTLEAHLNNNLTLTVKIFICGSDGTVKETLLAIQRDGLEYIATLANRGDSATIAGPTTVEDGDRLVIEIGSGGTPGPAASGVQGHNSSIRFGEVATSGDLPIDDSQTGTTYRPWLEFERTILFAAELPSIEATASVGSIASAEISVGLTGVEATGEVGTVSASPDRTAELAGVEATGAVEPPTSNITLALSGVAATGAVGNVTGGLGLTGVEAIGEVGSVIPGLQLSGQQADGEVGTVASAIEVALSGVSATAAAGTIQAQQGYSAQLTSIAATGEVGTVGEQLRITVRLTGVAASGLAGTLKAAQEIALPPGVEAIGEVGTPVYIRVFFDPDNLNIWVEKWRGNEWTERARNTEWQEKYRGTTWFAGSGKSWGS